MNSELSLGTRILVFISIFIFICTSTATADPVVAGEVIPPASAAFITDPELIKKIAVGREGEPVWCYSHDANAILITSKEQEIEKCELKLSQQKEKLEALHTLQINTLKIELESIVKQHERILIIKNQEIQDLTEAALKRPNDYSMWWASGGFVAGVLVTFGIAWVITK